MAALLQTTFSAGAGAWSWRRQALSIRVPDTQTSTHLESASASHRGAAASLLLHHQSELHGGACADHIQCRCRCVVAAAASTLHPSAGHTDEHASSIRLRLAS